MRTLRDTGGSVILASLIMALVLSALIGVYLSTVVQEVRNTHQTRLTLESINVAETGAEDALHSLINGDWTGWESGSFGYSREITLPGGLANEVRSVRTFIDPYSNPNQIVIVTEGEITHPFGFSSSRRIRIDLGRTSFFSNGITSREGIVLSGGNAYVDSYNSNNGHYHPDNRNDFGSIASVSIEEDAVNVGNAEVFGYVATGKEQPGVGPNGKVWGFDTPAGVNVDPSRISTDFYASFPEVQIPPPPGLVFTSYSGNTIGAAGEERYYRLDKLDIGGNNTVVIHGHVTLILDGNGTPSNGTFDIKGNGQLIVAPNSSLQLYVTGDVAVAGNGMANQTHNSQPQNLLVFGVAPAGSNQKLAFSGNAQMSSAIYAPNAEITLNGGGHSGAFFGSIVGKSVRLNGGPSFHYDEALRDLGTDGSFSLISWRELISPASRQGSVLAMKDAGL